MKENRIRLRPDRLNAPLETCFVGKLSSAVFRIGGDVPDDIDDISVQIGRTADPNTHDPRKNFTAAATRQPDGSFRCYLSPFHFPDVSDALKYHVLGTDADANPRWLGSGALVVRDCPANGSAVTPDVIPDDAYAYNPVTKLYHKLVAEVDEDGVITVAVEQKGVAK